MGHPAGTRFCDQDGTPLNGAAVARSTAAVVDAPTPAPVQPDEHVEDFACDYEDEPPRRSVLPWVAGIAALVIVSAAGLAYWTGKLDKWMGKKPDKELASAAASAPAASDRATGVMGVYKAHLADQDIVLTISGTAPTPLVASTGEISYRNTVNGGTCTSSLVVIKGGGIGGDTGNAIRFRQTAIPGKTACSADIPVTMDISGQPSGNGGIVASISVNWQSPKDGSTLMAGKLVLDGGN